MSKEPTAYLHKVCQGHICLKPVWGWVSYDLWVNKVTSAKTKRECEVKTRAASYVPLLEKRKQED